MDKSRIEFEISRIKQEFASRMTYVEYFFQEKFENQLQSIFEIDGDYVFQFDSKMGIESFKNMIDFIRDYDYLCNKDDSDCEFDYSEFLEDGSNFSLTFYNSYDSGELVDLYKKKIEILEGMDSQVAKKALEIAIANLNKTMENNRGRR